MPPDECSARRASSSRDIPALASTPALASCRAANSRDGGALAPNQSGSEASSRCLQLQWAGERDVLANQVEPSCFRRRVSNEVPPRFNLAVHMSSRLERDVTGAMARIAGMN